MKLAFFDTETTSEKDGRLVQLAILCDDGSGLTDTYKPPVPIDYEAMAVHHITQEMADRHAPFGNEDREWVRRFFNDRIPVAHNAAFDVAVMKREGIEIPEFICTLKVARRLWPEWPSHKLQYLRYRLGITIDAGPAHDAMADVKVLQAVFARIMYELGTRQEMDPYETMVQWTKDPSILWLATFGKYKGKTWADIAREDIGYLYWLQKQDCDPDLRATIEHWLNHYAQRIGQSV